MEPNSIALVVLLFSTAAAGLWIVVRNRSVIVEVVAGALALVLATTAGMAIVNDFYGYYQNWSQLSADLSGNYGRFAAPHLASRSTTSTAPGRLERVSLAGAHSGITRSALVYLPPQYFEKRYAHTAFPVLELIHGTPGSPAAWIVHLDIVQVAGALIAHHQMGPTILVMPTMSVGRHFQECVNAPGALDDTYLTVDVRQDIERMYRASRIAAEWGIAGYSSGGYCAANLALRHRGEFGAAGIMDGYFRPADGPAAAALHFNSAAEAANDPLLLAARLSRDVSPLSSFWLSAGTGRAADIKGALAFTAALHGVEQVPLYREPNAGHNFYAWQPAVPRLLGWMWSQLAPPQLRVQFPIAGPVRDSTIALPRNLVVASRGGRSRSSGRPTRSPLALAHAGRIHARTG